MKMSKMAIPLTKIKIDIGATAARNFLQSDGIDIAMTSNDQELSHRRLVANRAAELTAPTPVGSSERLCEKSEKSEKSDMV